MLNDVRLSRAGLPTVETDLEDTTGDGQRASPAVRRRAGP